MVWSTCLAGTSVTALDYRRAGCTHTLHFLQGALLVSITATIVQGARRLTERLSSRRVKLAASIRTTIKILTWIYKIEIVFKIVLS